MKKCEKIRENSKKSCKLSSALGSSLVALVQRNRPFENCTLQGGRHFLSQHWTFDPKHFLELICIKNEAGQLWLQFCSVL